jgi:glycosyltransferase involved in cell wall biosynthesis
MVSLIVATMNRVSELGRLLNSLDLQSFRDFEVILVDQNADDRLVGIITQHAELRLLHLRCPPGASGARNVGLRAAQGEIIGFPDDDCWYPEHLLQTVVEWFGSHPDCNGLFGVLRDAENVPVGPQWPPAGLCTAATLWVGGITPVAFLTRGAVKGIGFFDERIGPGAPSGYFSGEDADYFLRAVESGFRMWHEPSLTVHHPSFHAPERLRDKSYSYSLGGGYVLRTHRFPPRLFGRMLVRSIGGAVVRFLQADILQTRAYLLRTVGLARGYILGPREIGNSDLPDGRRNDAAETGAGQQSKSISPPQTRPL